MEQIIYGDVLFVVNFSMDFLALYITAFIMKLKFKLSRAMISGCIGGIYGVIAVSLTLSAIYDLILAIAIGIIMCVILSGWNGPSVLFREAFVFLVVNLVIGGGMTVLYSAFNSNGGAENILIYGDHDSLEQQLPLTLFAIGGIITAFILVLFGRGISKQRKGEPVKVFIEKSGKSSTVTGILDSGNLLVEPVSGDPVIIISKEVATEILDSGILKLLTERRINGEIPFSEKIRYILCETVSGKSMLGAFRPHRISVNGVDVNAWIAISDVFTYSGSVRYSAIVPTELVQR